MKISAKRVLCALLAGMVCLFAVLSTAYGHTVAAASEYASFDETPIEDDMSDIDVLQYPKDPLGKATLFPFKSIAIRRKHFYRKPTGCICTSTILRKRS